MLLVRGDPRRKYLLGSAAGKGERNSLLVMRNSSRPCAIEVPPSLTSKSSVREKRKVIWESIVPDRSKDVTCGYI